MFASRGRFQGALILVALATGILVARLVYLQIVGQADFSARADGNRLRVVFIPAPRGVIRDRNGVILAANRLSYAVTLYPSDSPPEERDRVATRLAKLLGLDREEIRLRWRKANRSARPVQLLQDVSPENIAIITENQRVLGGVTIEPVTVRFYPRGPLASHLIGYTGEIADQDLERLSEQGYRAGDIIGKTGVERVYDLELRGTPGRQQIEVDARGKLIRILAKVPPIPGKDLTLTLDSRLQEVADRMLTGSRGSLVAMDPGNGEVLALASAPAFDPNWFVGRITPDRWKVLNGPDHPLLNRAIGSVYPPGSVFKIVTHATALEERFATPTTPFMSTGLFYLGSRVFRDWKAGGFGRVDFQKALTWSIDTVYYELGLRMGGERMARYARGFGLGRQTGIVLPHEARGLVPDAAWKRKRFGERWYPGESVNMSIGQGYTQVSPIQAALLISTVANSGRLVRPHVVRPPRPGDLVPPELPPGSVDLRNLRPETWKAVHAACASVVSAGTATNAQLPGIVVGGKTGSAQSANGEARKTHGWFVAYAPVYPRPGQARIAVAAMREEAGHGGSVAAPIVTGVMRRFYGIPDPNATPSVVATPSVAASATVAVGD
ncbi:MAG: penicillin-binding protein 2 [bacterium]|nr:penicillin-binding protein 2 [bacterium]